VNAARVETTIALLFIAAFGVRHYRAFINPVSLAALPLAGALVAEELFLGPYAPFDLPAGLFIVGAVFAFGIGAALRPTPETARTEMRIKPKGGDLVLGLLLSTLAVLLYVGATHVRDAYNAVGDTLASGFDRGLVAAELPGVESYIVRLVTGCTILFAVPVAFYWLSRARLRVPVIVLYGIDLITLGFALRARLPIFLAVLLCVLVVYLGRSVTQRQPRLLKTMVGVAFLLIGAYFAFNSIYAARGGPAATTSEFVFSIAGGPSAMSEVVTGAQPVSLQGGQGVSIEGLLSLVGRQRTGNVTAAGVFGTNKISFVTLAVGSGNPLLINIFTGIGVLYVDIGPLPTLVVFFLLGILAESTWLRVVRTRTPGSITVMAGFALLFVSLPVTILSEYNVWWLIFLGPLLVNRMFRVELVAVAPSGGRPQPGGIQNAARDRPTQPRRSAGATASPSGQNIPAGSRSSWLARPRGPAG
jgi:hypothetical protein